MQFSGMPIKFSIPFGNNAGVGYIRNIPAGSQIGINDGFASLHDGFPPLNFLPLGAGGVPPFGQDMNGVLFQATAWAQWIAAGSSVEYDATFSGQIGGYPKGAMLGQAANTGQFWVSLVDNNASNPDSGGANWLNFPLALIGAKSFASNVAIFSTHGTFVWTVPTGVTRVLVECWGAGGAGGGESGGDGHGGSGGGGGHYCLDVVSGLTPGSTVNVVVGQGGASVIGALAGNAGGSSSFGAFVTAGGGVGGNYGSTGTYQAGTGTIGAVANNPFSGSGQLIGLGGGRGAQGGVCWITNVWGIGGVGGAAAGAGGAGGPATTADGNTGTSPGGGGSGAGGGAAVSSTSGGGADGMVRISWIDPT